MTIHSTAAEKIPAERGMSSTLETSQWLVCQIAHERYLLEVPSIKEIIRPPVLTAVPRGPAWLKGVCSLRGVVVAVIDVGRRLGMGDCRLTSKSRVIVLSTAKGLGGLLVEGVQELIELEAQQIDPPPPLLSAPHRECLRGIVHRNGLTYALLDLDKVVILPTSGREQSC